MNRLRLPLAALALPIAGLLAAGCGAGGEPASSAQPSASGERSDGSTVTVKTFEFSPDPVSVPAGTTITFVNEDAIDHTVTAGTREAPTPMVFDGALPEKGSTFDLTLDEPGTYDYFCRIHPGPGMTATIEVASAS